MSVLVCPTGHMIVTHLMIAVIVASTKMVDNFLSINPTPVLMILREIVISHVYTATNREGSTRVEHGSAKKVAV